MLNLQKINMVSFTFTPSPPLWIMIKICLVFTIITYIIHLCLKFLLLFSFIYLLKSLHYSTWFLLYRQLYFDFCVPFCRKKVQELCIYSLLHSEAGQTLLKIVCTGEDVIQQTILKQNRSDFDYYLMVEFYFLKSNEDIYIYILMGLHL